MSTENESQKARGFWLAWWEDEPRWSHACKTKDEAEFSARSMVKCGEVVPVREVLPGEPSGSARTFEEYWKTLKYSGTSSVGEWRTIDNAIVINTRTAVAIWNAAREGMMPAGTAAPAQEWVSVEERVPDNDANVLVWNQEFVEMRVGYLDADKWYGMLGKMDVYPTHWMPLPPPPTKPLTPFKKWWLSLPTHAGSDPENWRLVAGQLVHLATAVQVWKECEGFRGGGK